MHSASLPPRFSSNKSKRFLFYYPISKRQISTEFCFRCIQHLFSTKPNNYVFLYASETFRAWIVARQFTSVLLVLRNSAVAHESLVNFSELSSKITLAKWNIKNNTPVFCVFFFLYFLKTILNIFGYFGLNNWYFLQ